MPRRGRVASLSVAEYLEMWLEDYASTRLGPDTYRDYCRVVRKHLIPSLGDMPLQELSPLHVVRYINRALKQGRLDGKGGLSKRSVQYHYTILREALEYAVRWDLLDRNPADRVDPPVPERREPNVLTPEAVPAFLEAIKRTGHYYVPIALAVMTGMRRNEVLGLRWEDVDLENGVVRVTKVLKRIDGAFDFRKPKSKKSRRAIVLPEVLVEILRRHRAEQEERKRIMGPAYRDHGLVCCRPDGTPIVPSTFSTYFRSWIKRHAVFPRITLHGLRHSHATLLMGVGVHPKIVSERLGHSTINITLDLYTHCLPLLQKEAADRFDQIVNLGRD